MGLAREEAFGRILEVEAGFLHSSDMDPDKPINWKRMIEFNGKYGCMGDLGMHVLHIPLRLGWVPKNVRAILSNVMPERKGKDGKLVPCGTWDNATLLCEVDFRDGSFPMTLKTQRIAPGETNTWYITVKGTRNSARFTTKYPKTLETMPYEPGRPQAWRREDLGYRSVYPAITGGIFEFGFPDGMQQMMAAFCEQVEKGSDAELPFGCVTVEETQLQHQLFTAALESEKTKQVVGL
jgi:predicted dehydrogenase